MNIGWIGCGAMGLPMAKVLIDAGHHLKVYNRNSDRIKFLSALGAQVVDTPREAAVNNDFVFSVVSDDQASRQVWEGTDGAISGLAVDHRAIVIESSTITLERCTELQEKLHQHSDLIDFVTMPILGTPLDAEKKSLIFLIGGSEKSFNQMHTWLSKLAKDMIHVGTPQQAMALKLSITASISTQLLLQNELLEFLDKCQLSSEMRGFFNNLPFTNFISGILENQYESKNPALFPINLVKKDLMCLMKSQERKNLQPELSDIAHEIYSRILLKNT